MAIENIGLYPITIDVYKKHKETTVYANDNDMNGRGLLISLVKNGAQFDSTGITLKIGFRNAIGEERLYDCDIVNASEGQYKVFYPTEMLSGNGGRVVKLEIKAYEGAGALLNYAPLFVYVNASEVSDDAISGTNEASTLVNALSQVQDIDNRFNSVNAQLADIVINVKSYGAIGNGINNDTVPIQNAIDYVSSIGGGVVYLPIPSNYYNCTTPINLKSNVTLEGSSQDKCIIDFNNLTITAGITNSGRISNATIKNLTVQNVVGFGIKINGINNNPTKNVKIENVSVINTSISGIATEYCTDVTITKCFTKNTLDNGIYASFSKNIIITHNIVENAGGSGGIVAGYNGSEFLCVNVLIAINVIKSENNPNNLICGIEVTMAKNVNIIGNIVGDGKNGIIVEEHNIENVLIQGNLVNSLNQMLNKEVGIRAGYSLDSTLADISIINNEIIEYRNAITVMRTSKCIIKGNIIRTTGQDGMIVSDDSYVCSVEDNVFYNVGVQNLWNQFRCINITGINRATIKGNTFNHNIIGGNIYYSTNNLGTVMSDGIYLKLYNNGNLTATISNANTMTLEDLKTTIELNTGWVFEYEAPPLSKPYTLRRTGARHNDSVDVYPSTFASKCWVGEPECYGNILINNCKDYNIFENPSMSKFTNVDLEVINSSNTLISSQGQYKFPSLQNKSTDPNTLDDYKEGSWTPIVTFGSGSATYTSSGKFQKVGNMVYFNVNVTITSTGGSGTVFISLPYTSSDSIFNAYGSERSLTGKQLQGWIDGNSSVVSVKYYDYTEVNQSGANIVLSGNFIVQ